MRIKYETGSAERPQIVNSADAATMFYSVKDMKESLEHHEMFYAAYINTGGKVVGVLKISDGAIDRTSVDVRIVMQGALLTNAYGIILCHNHPSGSTRASEDDIKLTQRMKQAVDVFNMKILDHLILSKESYLSLADDGLL